MMPRLSSPSSSPLLTKATRILRYLHTRNQLPRSSVLTSPRSLKTLAISPIASVMEENGRGYPAPTSSIGGGGSGAGSSAEILTSTSGGERRNGEMDRFELSPSSALRIQKGDITVWFVDGVTDAIVNAANERMLGGGGVDGAIHRAAGPELRAACWDVPEVRPGVRCPTGEARITPAFRLPVSRVIHTVGPIYQYNDQPEVSLRNAYRSCLRLAKENNIQYIAFPAISCGVYGYPYEEASRIAISTIKEFSNDFKEVHFVLFSDDIYKVWLESALELL